MPSKYAPIYMHRRALACIRAFPEVLQGNADMYAWLEEAKVITQEEGGSFTQVGICLRQYLDDLFGPKSTTNFFTLEQALCCWEPWVIAAERPDAEAFLRLFGADFSSPDVKHFLDAAMSGKLKPKYNPVPGGVAQRYEIDETAPGRDLLALLALNETARAALNALMEEGL